MHTRHLLLFAVHALAVSSDTPPAEAVPESATAGEDMGEDVLYGTLYCTVEEIAEAVVWLASPAAGYVTGCLLDARGGF